MSNNLLREPPKWCADAIASPKGWKNPKTGELLISIKGIQIPMGTNPFSESLKETTVETLNEVLPVVETLNEVLPVVETLNEVQKPKGRKKTNVGI